MFIPSSNWLNPSRITGSLSKDEMLKYLEGSLDERKALARREDIPEDIIRKLSMDKHNDVKYEIAKHKNLPKDRLIAFSKSKKPSLTKAISCREDLPLEAIKNLGYSFINEGHYNRAEIYWDILPSDYQYALFHRLVEYEKRYAVAHKLLVEKRKTIGQEFVQYVFDHMTANTKQNIHAMLCHELTRVIKRNRASEFLYEDEFNQIPQRFLNETILNFDESLKRECGEPFPFITFLHQNKDSLANIDLDAFAKERKL